MHKTSLFYYLCKGQKLNGHFFTKGQCRLSLKITAMNPIVMAVTKKITNGFLVTPNCHSMMIVVVTISKAMKIIFDLHSYENK